ncbi:MAG: DUF3577 domain-containing protein [Gammaproteobacteria bacterium]|nr:DUF3577 domain-containing protein [Gammaproteobacteria bacterium]MCP5135424.1 DUF3577 domain-containing protein [Gammaproteobacteria bacterium]
MSTDLNNEGTFANLVTTGKGYLNYPRWFTPEEGDSTLWVSISAQRGKAKQDPKSGHVRYNSTAYDCKVVTPELIDLIKGLMAKYNFDYDAKDRPRVKLGFKIGDSYPYAIPGKEADKPKLVIKGRLFEVMWLFVNDELVYGEVNSTDDGDTDTETDSDDDAKASAEPTRTETAADEGDSAGADSPFDRSLEDVEKLDKADPKFDDKRRFLRDHGFRWDRELGAWIRQAA